MDIYLDNSATTRCLDEVKDIVVKLMMEDYGNPSSMHGKGFAAEKYIRQARESFAKIWKVSEKEIFFTSGGTESDNLAVMGSAMANRRKGMHLITTKMEHAAVSAPMHALEEQGFQVDYLSVDRYGRICLEELKELVRQDTILVSIMHVNNEIGAVQPIEEAGKLIKQINPNCLFHVDDIQGFGKYKIYPKKMGIDFLSVSGHKIHGPKGIGVLYANEKAKINPILFGGGQQKGMRSGTENVPGIAGIAIAAKECYKNFEENQSRLYQLKEIFSERVLRMDGVQINGLTGQESAPHIISVSVKGVRSEVLLHSMEDRGIYISAGSACASNKPAISETLKAIGLDKTLLDSTVRFSISVHTTQAELEYAADVMEEILPKLRKYSNH